MKEIIRQCLPYALFMVAGLALTLWGVNLPYVGIYNANNNYLALASKNFLRFGFLNLHYLPTYFAGGMLPSDVPYYLHHPVLFFIIAAVAFAWFGTANWVVHAATFAFTVGSVAAIFMLVGEVWDRRTAIISASLASIFPMLTFFWKYEFFEQITLCLNLVVLYAYVRFVKTGLKKYLYTVAVVAFIATLSDWYGAYLLFPFLFMLFTPYRRKTLAVLGWYLSGVAAGIMVFLGIVWSIYGSARELAEAIRARAYASELYTLTFWPLRLFAISAIRAILFFTPVPLAGLIFVKRKIFTPGRDLKTYMLIIFIILGSLNLIFLPTATWGHSYFLFYFIPLFAVSGAFFIETLHPRSVTYAVLGMTVVWSTVINFLKLQQIEKQLWKYEFGKAISALADQHERIGTVNYPGDVLQNYWLIPAEPMDVKSLEQWYRDPQAPPRIVVFTCHGECTEEEKLTAAGARNFLHTDSYQYGTNIAWIFRKSLRPSEPNDSSGRDAYVYPDPWNGQPAYIMTLYRFIRDRIGGMQI